MTIILWCQAPSPDTIAWFGMILSEAEGWVLGETLALSPKSPKNMIPATRIIAYIEVYELSRIRPKIPASAV